MDTKLQLQHPAGKKAVRMDKGKYAALRTALLHHLKTAGASTHAEIFQTVREAFDKQQPPFEGSVEWHLEWVKLDLEARKEIKRLGDKSPVKFAVVE